MFNLPKRNYLYQRSRATFIEFLSIRSKFKTFCFNLIVKQKIVATLQKIVWLSLLENIRKTKITLKSITKNNFSPNFKNFFLILVNNLFRKLIILFSILFLQAYKNVLKLKMSVRKLYNQFFVLHCVIVRWLIRLGFSPRLRPSYAFINIL